MFQILRGCAIVINWNVILLLALHPDSIGRTRKSQMSITRLHKFDIFGLFGHNYVYNLIIHRYSTPQLIFIGTHQYNFSEDGRGMIIDNITGGWLHANTR